MGLNDVLQIASVILSIAFGAGFGLQRGYVTNLREQVDDERKQKESLKAERADDKSRIAQLASDNAALQRVVTGEVHWQAISDMLDHHHKVAQEQWERQSTLLERQSALLAEIRDALGRRSE